MMDYYSDYPAPPEEDIINDITKILLKTLPIARKHTIEKCIKSALKEMGGRDSLGSYSGYIVFTKKDLINRSTIKLNNSKIKSLSFKSLVTVIIKMNSLYYNVLHNRYKPYSDIYYETEKEFYKKTASFLPPIGKKTLYGPIKDHDCMLHR